MSVLAGPAAAEKFFVEMPDGTFKRCGNLDYKPERGEWRMRGCHAIAQLFVAPTPTAKPTPTSTPRPTQSPADPLAPCIERRSGWCWGFGSRLFDGDCFSACSCVKRGSAPCVD